MSSAPSPQNPPTPLQGPSSPPRVSSRWVLGILAVLVLGGVALWSRADFMGREPFDPEVAHDFSRVYQRRCNRDHDKEFCKKVHGLHHRRCFREHLRPEDPTKPDSPPVYSRPAYIQCMFDAVADMQQAASGSTAP